MNWTDLTWPRWSVYRHFCCSPKMENGTWTFIFKFNWYKFKLLFLSKIISPRSFRLCFSTIFSWIYRPIKEYLKCRNFHFYCNLTHVGLRRIKKVTIGPSPMETFAIDDSCSWAHVHLKMDVHIAFFVSRFWVENECNGRYNDLSYERDWRHIDDRPT